MRKNFLWWRKGFPLKSSSRLRSLLAFLVLALTTVLASVAGCGQTPVPGGVNREGTQRESAARTTGERYDLARDEERGGHTLKKHIGQSDEQLLERLLQEGEISAASTWTDRETAEATVADAVRAERGRIENWMRRGYPRANLALHYDAGRMIGRSLRRGESQTVECSRAVIVLRADGLDGYYVLTSYPEARE
jgi:hypothetical protein